MKTEANPQPKKRPIKRILLTVGGVILITSGALLYINFNRLLSMALMASFESSIVSDVYDLKFNNLQVNIFEGNIRLNDVTMMPREKPRKNYPYINSYFRLKTERLTLKKVEIFRLLKLKKLRLERIAITQPEIEVVLTGKRHIILPYKDSTASSTKPKKNRKKIIDTFTLKEFQLIDASFHTTNAYLQREFNIQNLNLSVYDLNVNQDPGEYEASVSKVNLAIENFGGRLKKGGIQKVGFKDFKIGIDTLSMKTTIDTLLYQFHDFTAGLHALDVQTADSTFHISMQSFDLSYLKKAINLNAISIKPNVSHAQLQKDHKYQHAEFYGSVGNLSISQVNFDSLLYTNRLLIDEVVLDSVNLSIFKDKTKPMDSTRRPVYLSQAIKNITIPLRIQHVKATHVYLTNTERKPDSTYAKVKLTRATLYAQNITNFPSVNGLNIKADAYVNNKARFNAELTYHYNKPQVDFVVAVKKFNMPDLNPLIQAYTPAKINNGILDEIAFSGVAGATKASGTMKFLYHDLEIDLALRDQAKWKSSIIAFAANSVLNSNNPAFSNSPPRIVQFHIQRDPTKGFINVIIKSLLNGLKETMIMSKENRKAYNKAKKINRKK